MTPAGYLIARAGQAFGFLRKAQRMADAASETHLLRDAEMFLGEEIWRETESVEALAVEYWSLRKLDEKAEVLQTALTKCDDRLRDAHNDRSLLLNEVPEETKRLQSERSELLAKLDVEAKERDGIVENARTVRRQFTGLKTKFEVLMESSSGENSEETNRLREQLLELKSRFERLKDDRATVVERMEKCSDQIHEIDARIQREKAERRERAAKTFQGIGESNKALSTIKAELSLIQTQMRQLKGEIGRYISRHAHEDKTCKKASSSQRSLVEIMRALRNSIAYNNKLSERA